MTLGNSRTLQSLLDKVVGATRRDPLEELVRQGAVIEQLVADSRRCARGTAFFAYPGETSDGRRYVDDAIARGASAVLWDSEGFTWRREWVVPNVGVHGLKLQAGFLAHRFYGRPSESLWTCGVTGTNGKTSCTQWLATLLTACGVKSGVIGTLGSGFPEALAALSNTTPDALELHRILRDMQRAGARAVALEVSSHGLLQGRVNGVAFNCALFTNLSHDHLDYHGSMEEYAEAKARLFEAPGLEAAVLNLDDVLGVQLARRLQARRVRTIGYSLSQAAMVPRSVTEYIAARHIRLTSGSTAVEISSSWGEAHEVIDQVGRFNVANALGVLGCLMAHGVDFRAATEMLRALPEVPGRMQRLGGINAPLVVVDYAHTPDALDNVLQALRPAAAARGGRLIVVFGAGGDRDRAKRPVMGEVAERRADRVVLTSDNPRSEDPRAIIAAVRAGMQGSPLIEPDRAAAIEAAIIDACAEDVVLLAGKGHEAYQEIGDLRVPFSDAAAARAALKRRGQR